MVKLKYFKLLTFNLIFSEKIINILCDIILKK